MASLHSDLSEFVGLLDSHRVEYLVIGGHAVAFHGYPRFTGDIDFFVRATRENAERLLRVLDSTDGGRMKPLHAVEMTREIRDHMYEETKDMAADELIHYFKENAKLVTPPAYQEEREARRSQG